MDVGYGQLAWSIRSDKRVVCLERTNARYLTKEQIPEPLDFASIDVSFISLKLILPALRRLMAENGQVVALVKPQFEAGREKVGKKGVVRDSAVHQEVLEHFLVHADEADFSVKGLTFSPHSRAGREYRISRIFVCGARRALRRGPGGAGQAFPPGVGGIARERHSQSKSLS